VRSFVVVAIVVGMFGGSARAEHWYEGRYARNRITHLAITATGGAMFVASETFLKPDLAAVACRWCNPPAFDTRIRNALVWRDTNTARTASNLTGYVSAPGFAIGITLFGSFGYLAEDEPPWARVIDDVVPVFETVVLSQVLAQAVKFSVARERPFVHFGFPARHDIDDNVSFFSGHSALAFGLATSAGVIAHYRGYRTEPYVWGIGMTLAASTAYLRIAADRHYATDVLAGTAVGVAAGLTVPLLMRRDDSIAITPTANGLAIAGTF
jgi:membrane-associated phospholipid phosphatase